LKVTEDSFMPDITQIKIGSLKVGLIGLEKIFEEGKSIKNRSGEDLKLWLVSEAKKENYIPDRAFEDYAKALFREYRKFTGEKVEDEKPEGLEIKVLGAGCFSCDKLEKDIIQLLEEQGITADFEHVRDLKEIGAYGVFGTPALVINGVVKTAGRVPKKKEILKWIDEALK